MSAESLIIILNLFILESLLSVDNAAVLAVMVKDLPGDQRTKALRYGLIGAYVFRGACLFAAAWLVKVVWLKIVGGAYLLYLVYSHFAAHDDDGDGEVDPANTRIFRIAAKIGMSQFWATVVLVEIMDLAFSIDNIFAAVALSDNFWIIMTGVAIGILAMRFVAGWFVKLIERYPSLEGSAFVVIALLGLKLILSGVVDYIPDLLVVKEVLENHVFDLAFSASMMLIFFIPLMLTSRTRT
jgi:YkoY family integral membrane protein